jgi:formate-dependent nitrite reductase membrane component NrfD
MTAPTISIAPHRFAFGYYRQVWWNWLISTAFFLGGIGSGLFVVSWATHYALGILVGYLIVVIGKNTAHLLYLGRPERFWRAAMRPDRSWIARGIWASAIFAVSGLVCLLALWAKAPWQFPSWLTSAAAAVALASALFISFYDGFVMNHSAAIPFWNSRLLPILVLMYATLGGVTLSLTLRELQSMDGSTTEFLAHSERLLLAMNFLLLCGYLWRMANWAPAAHETVRSLLRGTYARAFVGLVFLIGIGATLLLSLLQDRVQATWLVLLIATCELTGDFTLMLLLLKSGLFAPQTARRHLPGNAGLWSRQIPL